MRGRNAGGSRLLARGKQVNFERQAGWRVKVTILYLADLSG